MAVIRNTASAKMRGKVGNTTYYVMNGQQIARQSQNNSNYGESASRSDSQQTRRVKWGNLVNLYKALSFWMPRAFESKASNQSDYNRFMSVNVNTSPIALTKDQALNGCSVVANYTISQGSLMPLNVRRASETVDANILAGVGVDSSIAVNSTIAQLSQSIIRNNAGWQDGDNLAFVIFTNERDDRGYPYAGSRYFEFTLDLSNQQSVSSLPISAILTYFGVEELQVEAFIPSIPNIVGMAFIHTRRSGKLLVSTQDILMLSSTIVDLFSSEDQIAEAIKSYGVSEEVPLEPSFLKASIKAVAINGSLSDTFRGRILQYSMPVELVIEGDNLTAESVYLMHDDVRYTPLAREDGKWTYILGGNGVNRLYVNGVLYGGVEIAGVEVPDGLPARITMSTSSNDSAYDSQQTRGAWSGIVTTDCLNFPQKANDAYPRFFFRIYNQTPLSGDFEYVNCEVADTKTSSEGEDRLLTITDWSSPAYILYENYIIAVFNYS